jgi:hypothetical protein
MNLNGSGSLALFGKDENEGIGGTVHPVLAPLCVTVTVCDGTPVPDTVTVAERGVVLVFSCAVTVTIALFEPDVGLSVSHV